MSKRVQAGDVESLVAAFVNASLAGVTGLSPTVRIQRVSDGQFWNGTGYAASPTNHAMTAVGATNMPGVYAYSFDTGAGGGASEEEHRIRAVSTSSAVINPLQFGSLHVGGFIDNLDAAVSSREASGAAAAAVATLNDPSAATIAAAVWDRAISATQAAGSIGLTVLRILAHAAGPWRTKRGDPWQQVVTYPSDVPTLGGTEADRYDLRRIRSAADAQGAEIADGSGVNPIDDNTVEIGEREEP